MMEDEYECTVPCDDVVAFDSPISEPGLLNIDTNTEVLDVCESIQHLGDQMEDYIDIEVVLDSDDEVGDFCGAVNSANERFPALERLSGRDATGLLRRRRVPAGCFRRLDKKVSEHVHLYSTRSARSDGESKAGRTSVYDGNRLQKHHVVVDSAVSMLRDQKPVSLNPVEPDFLNPVRESLVEESLEERKLSSHEYKPTDMGKVKNYICSLTEFNYVESSEDTESQDKALRFVDHYLSVNDLGLYRDVQTRKTNLTKSPPPLRSKGSQSLAKRINLGSSASKLKTFDWSVKTEKQIKKHEYASPRMNEGSIFESKDDNSGCLSLNEESNNANLHNKISDLQSKEKMPGNMLSSNETENIGSNSGIHIVYDSMEFDEQLDAGLSRDDMEKVEELSLVPDALDIGLDTQVAAEAMEELMHAVCPRFDACFTHKDSGKTLMDTKCESNHVAKYGETFVGWRSKGKRSKCMKISDVQAKAKSWSAVKRNGKFRAPSRITFQQEENGYNEQCSLKKYSRRSKRKTDGIKFDSSTRLKEMVSFQEDAHTCLKSNFGSSSETKIDPAKREENSNLDGGDWTFSKLNPWVYPKRKRTRQHTPLLSISSSNDCSPSLAVGNHMEKYPTANEEAQHGVSKLLVYNRRRKFPLKLDISSSVNGSALSIGISDTDKPSRQCGTLDCLKPSSLDASSNMKSNLLSNGHMTSQIFEGSEKRNQPSNSLPRSPLMKELTRLGYTGSLPDFLSKDSRRQRATKKICILFSQNLEEGTLKQQKKIIARLGLSIASCCSSATHFVADRFVRTRNMLEAIALGKPVVTHLWLENCEQAGYVIAEKSYILRDEKKEKEIGFNMTLSLSRAIKLPLLKGRRVLVTPNVKPSIDVINSLIKAVQGQAVQSLLIDKMKDKLILDDLLIISVKEDYTICLQFLEKGACIYDSELLLNGIVTQKLEYERHRLFEDFKENGLSCVS